MVTFWEKENSKTESWNLQTEKPRGRKEIHLYNYTETIELKASDISEVKDKE